ncbi:hypothetical protein D3C81_784610 [compost metagenome]
MTAYIRQAAHQIQIEVGLEDRLVRLPPVVRTFIAVQAQTTRVQGHAFGHDHQCMGVQTIPCAQQDDPIGLAVQQQCIDITEAVIVANLMLYPCNGRRRQISGAE